MRQPFLHPIVQQFDIPLAAKTCTRGACIAQLFFPLADVRRTVGGINVAPIMRRRFGAVCPRRLQLRASLNPPLPPNFSVGNLESLHLIGALHRRDPP